MAIPTMLPANEKALYRKAKKQGMPGVEAEATLLAEELLQAAAPAGARGVATLPGIAAGTAMEDYLARTGGAVPKAKKKKTPAAGTATEDYLARTAPQSTLLGV